MKDNIIFIYKKGKQTRVYDIKSMVKIDMEELKGFTFIGCIKVKGLLKLELIK
jgi:hypothetical protein